MREEVIKIIILSIDPGNVQSAWVIMDEYCQPLEFAITENNEFLKRIREDYFRVDEGNGEIRIGTVAIEKIASYGMAVGATVFDTCVWIGRFQEAFECKGTNVVKVYRKDVKMNLCGNTRAKDGNIRQALIDRFGVVGVKKSPGWFYGFKADIWAAYAVGVSYMDLKEGQR